MRTSSRVLMLSVAAILCSQQNSQLKAASQANPITLHVSIQGDDQKSGLQPQNRGNDGPLATPEAALRAARALRKKSPNAPITVLFHEGTYALREPLVITAEDSGSSAEAPFTLAAARNEKPVFSGGYRLTGWQPVVGRPGLWEAPLPTDKSRPLTVRSFFVAGERRTRARTPNDGYFRIQGKSSQDHPMKLAFAPGEIRKEWADAGNVEIVALLAWTDARLLIRQVDETKHVATLSSNPHSSNQEKNARYYVENAPDGLDAPGEWQHDEKAGVMRYLAKPGEDPRRLETIIGHLDDLVIIQGSRSLRSPVKHVLLRGLTFSHTEAAIPQQGYADPQAAVGVHGDLRASLAVDCVVEDCRFTHLGGYGLELGEGCQRWTVSRNEFADLGAGGIRIGETSPSSDPLLQCHTHQVIDNDIHHLGNLFHAGNGILSLQSGTNHLAHNHIHHLNSMGISVGWNWGYNETPTRENVIEFNHLHDIGQGLLSDVGAIYTLGPQPGTVVRNNLIHDVTTFTYGGWGLYPDEGTSQTIWENNVVYHCKSAGFHQHYGRENIVRNNIFALNRESQLMRTRAEKHLSFTLTNNIIYFDSGVLLGSDWSGDQYVLEGNLYFDARPSAKPGELMFGSRTWDEWRQQGHDSNSIVANPKFVAPAKGNFELRKDSPAFSLGFKPIDLHDVGVRPRR